MYSSNGNDLTIKSIKESKIAAKLIAMGILPGSKMRIIRKGPLGKVYFVQVDQARFALREDELNAIVFSS